MTTDMLEKTAENAENWFSNEAATFGDRLAAAREAAGLGQAELAQRLGVKTKVIEQWEADAKEPRANRLQMVAGMLGVSLMWLLTGEGDGVEMTEDGDDSVQVKGVLAEIRELRSAMTVMTGRLGRLEKKLRQGLERGAA
jgi:transcriptional regulator with XRE-family HTH domain